MIKIIHANDIRLTEARKCKNKASLQKAKNIITRFGQFTLVLVRPEGDDKYNLIAGSVILSACRELGVNNVLCFVFPEKVTLDEVNTLRLIQNTPRELDVLSVANGLAVMDGRALDRLANVLPFTRNELRNFKALKDFEWEKYDNDIQNFQTTLFG